MAPVARFREDTNFVHCCSNLSTEEELRAAQHTIRALLDAQQLLRQELDAKEVCVAGSHARARARTLECPASMEAAKLTPSSKRVVDGVSAVFRVWRRVLMPASLREPGARERGVSKSPKRCALMAEDQERMAAAQRAKATEALSTVFGRLARERASHAKQQQHMVRVFWWLFGRAGGRCVGGLRIIERYRKSFGFRGFVLG